MVHLNPTRSDAELALAHLTASFSQLVRSCVDVPRVGCVPEDVHSDWLGFAFLQSKAVLDVRLPISDTDHDKARRRSLQLSAPPTTRLTSVHSVLPMADCGVRCDARVTAVALVGLADLGA